MPTKVWQPGEAVISSDFNQMVQEQVVPTFATAAARDAAIPAPKVGMFCFMGDRKLLMEYTDASPVPGWHRPWGQPWGVVAGYVVPDFHFGGWAAVAGSDYNFPPGLAGRTLSATFECNVYKDADGGDAHTVLRLQSSSFVYLDSIHTIHQGWVGHHVVTHTLSANTTDQANIMVFAMSTWGTAWTQWSRMFIEDLGPAPSAVP